MNQLKQITKWLLINMKKIVRKMAFMMFDEQYFKKNVIIGLTLIFLTLRESLSGKFEKKTNCFGNKFQQCFDC